jgi:hypothetical protein
MIVRNNASAVTLSYLLKKNKIINDSSAENLTGLKQSTDIVLVLCHVLKTMTKI